MMDNWSKANAGNNGDKNLIALNNATDEMEEVKEEL
jgi:hypothetical protein